MEATVPKQELSPLSATKAKTLENCSWMYWCNYHLKLPQDKSDGARKGDVCHWVFEILFDRAKHGELVEAVSKAGSITISPALCRLVKIYMKRTGLPDHHIIFKHLDDMIVVGLRSDFYIKGGQPLGAEYRFDIVTDEFRIKGLMDKPYVVGNNVFIDDYKSSKQKFTGEDEESNLQALMYSYAARKLWPDRTPIVRFIFLQFPEDPMMTLTFSDSTLKGFERYLSEVQKRVNVFNLKSAHNNFAADFMPTDGTFSGRLVCGFAKQPGQKKKDGTKMWHCPFKFAFDYLAVTKEGKISYTVFKEEELKPLKAGEVVTKMRYEGCPRFRNAVDIMGKPVVDNSAPKVFKNVLDDF